MLAEDLKKVGLELQPEKSKCHIDVAHRNYECDLLRGNIPAGVLKAEKGEAVMVNGSQLYVMTMCKMLNIIHIKSPVYLPMQFQTSLCQERLWWGSFSYSLI